MTVVYQRTPQFILHDYIQASRGAATMCQFYVLQLTSSLLKDVA